MVSKTNVFDRHLQSVLHRSKQLTGSVRCGVSKGAGLGSLGQNADFTISIRWTFLHIMSFARLRSKHSLMVRFR